MTQLNNSDNKLSAEQRRLIKEKMNKLLEKNNTKKINPKFQQLNHIKNELGNLYNSGISFKNITEFARDVLSEEFSETIVRNYFIEYLGYKPKKKSRIKIENDVQTDPQPESQSEPAQEQNRVLPRRRPDSQGANHTMDLMSAQVHSQTGSEGENQE